MNDPVNGRASGFSLVELMIAMALGLFVAAGMIAVFAGNKRSSDLNSAMSNLQESARFALDRIASDVRLAGFQGCPDLNRSSRVAPAARQPLTDDLRSTATTASVVRSATEWSPAAPTGFDVVAARAIVGSHVLGLQFGGPMSRKLAGPQLDADGLANPSVPLRLDDAPELPGFSLAVGDEAIVSSCNLVETFRVSSVSRAGEVLSVWHDAIANRVASFVRAHGFAVDAEEQAGLLEETRVMRLQASVYYVAENGLENASGDRIRSLYRQSLPFAASHPPTEIVRGAEQLRVSFGVADGRDRLRFLTPDHADFDPARVESVRLGLLMASYDGIGGRDDANTYLLAGGQPIEPRTAGDAAGDAAGGVDVHGGDRRYRLAFNTTVKVRNRRR